MKRFTTDAIARIHYLSMPDQHPDGTKTAYVKTTAQKESGSFLSQVFEVDHRSGEVLPVTSDRFETKRPLYSPDGSSLAFLSAESGEFQIHLKNEEASEDNQHTTLRHGITYYDWALDGTSLVFTAPLWAEELEAHVEFTEMEPEEKASWREEKDWAPIEITEIDYKNDDCYGVRDGSITRIGVLLLTDGKQQLLQTGGMECSYPVFSRDGKRIAFFGKPYSGAFASVVELFLYDLERDTLAQITKDRKLMLCHDARPLFSKDGDCIITSAYYMDEKDGFAEVLYEIELSTGNVFLLFDPKDETVTCGVNSMTVSRTVYGADKPFFDIDYETGYLYFKNAWLGRENLYRITLEHMISPDQETPASYPKIEVVYADQMNIHAFCLPRQGHMILLGGDLQTIAELYEYNPATGDRKQLTSSNDWIREYELAKTQELWVLTKDKKSMLQIWITKPIGWEPGKKYPMVLDIHGGPECTYVADFWHEFQAFAEAGFVCIYTNPRGSVGYGMEFSGNDYAYQKEAVEDLLQAVDTVVDLGMADPERIGITGGSYGGYMTLKLITETTRFHAAAAQRSLANMATSYGTGDMGFLSRGSKDTTRMRMLDVLVNRARKSLIRNVDNINIPLLLLHGYKDYRCSFEQSEQLFVAMKERKPEVPARLVMFPEENHGITRTGKLHSQIRHLQEMIQWFRKYLQGGDQCNE